LANVFFCEVVAASSCFVASSSVVRVDILAVEIAWVVRAVLSSARAAASSDWRWDTRSAEAGSPVLREAVSRARSLDSA
jgi:hypothetical protein